MINLLEKIASSLPVRKITDEYKNYEKYTHNNRNDGVEIYRLPKAVCENLLKDLNGEDISTFISGLVIEVVFLEKNKASELRPHKHEKSEAVLLKLSGDGSVILDGYKKQFINNEPIKIKKGQWHSIDVASGVLVFISVQYPCIAEVENGQVDIQYLPILNVQEIQDALWKTKIQQDSFDIYNYGKSYNSFILDFLGSKKRDQLLNYHLLRYVFSYYNPLTNTWSKYPYQPKGREVTEDLMQIYDTWTKVQEKYHLSTFYYNKLNRFFPYCRGISARKKSSLQKASMVFYTMEEEKEQPLLTVEFENKQRKEIITTLEKYYFDKSAILFSLVNVIIEEPFKKIFDDDPNFKLGFIWLALDDAEYSYYQFIPSPSDKPVVSLVLYWKANHPEPNLSIVLKMLQLFLAKEIVIHMEERRAAEFATTQVATSLSHALKKPVNLIKFWLIKYAMSEHILPLVIKKLDEVKNIVTLFDLIRDKKRIQPVENTIAGLVEMLEATVRETLEYAKLSKADILDPAACLERIVNNDVRIPVVNHAPNARRTLAFSPVVLQLLFDENILNMYRHTVIQGVENKNLQNCFRIEVGEVANQAVEIRFINRDSLNNIEENRTNWEAARWAQLRDKDSRIAQGMYLNNQLCKAVGWEFIYHADFERQESHFIIRLNPKSNLTK